MAIEKIEAHEELIAVRVSGFPHWKEAKDREKHMERLKKAASMEKPKVLTNKDIAKMLGMV